MEISSKHLPKIAKFKPRGISASPEQHAIQTATQKEILIQANAGAAKTTTLALRMAESLMRGVAPEHMLALAMTPAARRVLQERLAELGLATGLIKRIYIATFEDLARHCLQQMEGGECVYLEDDEQLRPLAVQALENICEMHGNHFELDANFSNLALHQFLQMQGGLKARFALFTHDIEGYEPEEIAHLLDIPLTTYFWHVEYERLRGADDMADFRGQFDASYDLARRLFIEPEQCQQLPAFSVVLCDEMHDLNEVCFRILTALIQRGNAYFCGAGDKDQVIYSWRGAEHQFMRERFAALFPRLKEYPLTACYRYGAKLAAAVAHFKRKPNTSALQQNSVVAVQYYAAAENGTDPCSALVLAEVQAWLKQGGKLGQIAILLRNPSQSIALETALLRAHLAYKTEGMASFLQRLEILILRGMVAIAMQNLDLVKLKEAKEAIFEAMIVYAEIPYDAEEYEQWQKSRAVALSQAAALEWFFEGILQRKSTQSGAAMLACVNFLRQQAPDAKAGTVLQQVFQIMHLDQVARRIYVDREQAAFVQASIAQFIRMCDASAMNLQEFSDWLGEAEWRLAQKTPKDALSLACVDAIKGREYPCVILPYLTRQEFPRPHLPQLEEENRFYVAITRSQQRLVLLAPQEESERSRFLAQMCIGQAAPALAAIPNRFA